MLWALIGAALAVALHLYFVANWRHYAGSVSPVRMTQTGGVAPAPSLAATRLSVRDGGVVLLLAGAAIAFLARRRALDCIAFAAGATLINLGLGYEQWIGNLWPIGMAALILLSIVPVAAGSAIGSGLRMLTR